LGEGKRRRKLKKQYKIVFTLLTLLLLTTIGLSVLVINVQKNRENRPRTVVKEKEYDITQIDNTGFMDGSHAEDPDNPEYNYESTNGPRHDRTVDYCRAWPIIDLKLYEDTSKANVITTISAGTFIIVMDEDGSLFNVYDGENFGYVDSNYCMINLPDYFGDELEYDITNSYSSVFKIHDVTIPDITGTVIKGFEGVCITPNNYLVPYLYPCAKKLGKAIDYANQSGYTFKIYEAFRPHVATTYLYDSVSRILNNKIPVNEMGMVDESADATQSDMEDQQQKLYDDAMKKADEFIQNNGIDPNSVEAQNAISYFLEDAMTNKDEKNSAYDGDDGAGVVIEYAGKTYGAYMTNNTYSLGMFLARVTSAHNRGIALDLTLVDNYSRSEIPMQSPIHDLSYHSVTTFNNENAKLLDKWMKNAGFGGLSSEWWHFQDNDTRSNIGLNSYLEGGVSYDASLASDLGITY